MSNLDLAPLVSVKDKIKNCSLTLLEFLKNPVTGMKALPDWPWQETVILFLAMSAVCGAANGVMSGKFLNVVAGILFYPIGTLILASLFTGFFYYVFLFFYKREFEVKKLFTHMVFASIPSLLFSILSPVLPPALLFGMVASFFLLVVGFTENFGLPRKKVSQLLAGIFLIYLIFWIFSSISFQKTKDSFRDQATPESIDILEQELKGE